MLIFSALLSERFSVQLRILLQGLSQDMPWTWTAFNRFRNCPCFKDRAEWGQELTWPRIFYWMIVLTAIVQILS